MTERRGKPRVVSMSKPRRVRYTVEAQKGAFGEIKKFDYLVYPQDLTGARAQLIRKGWRIKSFKPASEDRRSNPNAGWRVSTAGLERAKREFGLTLPIRIKQTSVVGGREGAHRLEFSDGLPVHNIRAKSYLTPERATEVLWHELTHAAQAERAIQAANGDVTAWGRESKRQRQWAYKDRPIEMEANRNMRNFRHIPLAIRGVVR